MPKNKVITVLQLISLIIAISIILAALAPLVEKTLTPSGAIFNLATIGQGAGSMNFALSTAGKVPFAKTLFGLVIVIAGFAFAAPGVSLIFHYFYMNPKPGKSQLVSGVVILLLSIAIMFYGFGTMFNWQFSSSAGAVNTTVLALPAQYDLPQQIMMGIASLFLIFGLTNLAINPLLQILLSKWRYVQWVPWIALIIVTISGAAIVILANLPKISWFFGI